MKRLIPIAFLVITILLASQAVWLSQFIKKEKTKFNLNLTETLQKIIQYHSLRTYGATGVTIDNSSSDIDDNYALGSFHIDSAYSEKSSMLKVVEEAFIEYALSANHIKISKIDSLFRCHFEDTALLSGYHMQILKNQIAIDSIIFGQFSTTNSLAVTIPLGTKGIYAFSGSFNIRKSLFVRKMLFSVGFSAISIILVALFMGLQIKALYDSQRKLEWKQRMTGGIVHDLKSPLAYVYTMLDIFENTEQKETKRTQLGIAKNRIENLSEKVALTLTIFKTQDHATVLNSKSYSLAKRCAAMMTELQQIYVEKIPEYSISIPENLEIFVDAFYFEAALRNLLDNAIKYGGNPAKVEILSTFDNSAKLHLSITDNGEGIKKSEQKRVFKAYYRGKSATAKGYGIGLSFARQMIAMHGGKITLRSEQGKGSTFTIILPKNRLL